MAVELQLGPADEYHQATMVGAGVIGVSWAARFLAHGLRVTICDGQPGVEQRVRAGLREIAPTLGPAMTAPWSQLGTPSLDDHTTQLLDEQAANVDGTGAELARRCDEAQIRLSRAFGGTPAARDTGIVNEPPRGSWGCV